MRFGEWGAQNNAGIERETYAGGWRLALEEVGGDAHAEVDGGG